MDIVGKPSLNQWKELYEIANKINKQKPWEYLWDSDLIMIQLPEMEEPFYCCVMGRNGECYAVSIYYGHKSLWKYFRMRNSMENEPPFISLLIQDCLTCYFGDRDELTKSERDIIKEAGLKFRGRNQWPFFKSMREGYYPWFIDSGEAVLLTKALQNLFKVCEHITDNDIEVKFDEGETIYRHYDKENNVWLNSVIEMPTIPYTVTEYKISDDLLVARLKKNKTIKSSIEMDVFYVPAPIQENKSVRPHLMKICIIADILSGRIIDQYMLEADDTSEIIVINMLDRFISNNGKPSFLRVRDLVMESIVKDLCYKIGVKLVSGEGCPVIDEFIIALDEHMGT